MNYDPADPDAPLLAFMSVRENTALIDATPEQLRSILNNLRTLSATPQALTKKLSENKPKTARPKKSGLTDAQRAAIKLDLL